MNRLAFTVEFSRWNNSWILIYDVQTEETGRIILEMTIDAAKKLRAMP
jgi:hypothetical protein